MIEVSCALGLIRRQNFKMLDWDISQWIRFLLIGAAIFAIVGGIVSQSTGGVSGRGFWEGMWKGVEMFFIIVAIGGAIVAVLWVMGFTASSLNSTWD